MRGTLSLSLPVPLELTLYVCVCVCNAAEQGQEKLLDLNPYDVKRLLHLIFSRKEFTVFESESSRTQREGEGLPSYCCLSVRVQ